MKQKSIILVVILIILVAGLFIIFYPKEKPTGFFACSDEYEEALNKSDISLCEFTISTETSQSPYYDNACRESCIQNIAVNKGDAQLCELLNNFKNIPHAEGWDDPRETGSYIDHCYIQLASKLDNVSLCNSVETDWAKTHCPELI